jgi:hypothetical protein
MESKFGGLFMSRLEGVSGGAFNIQPETKTTTAAKLSISFGLQEMQAQYKAFIESLEGKNPLKGRVQKFKKGEYPFEGKNIPGPATNVPSTRR